MENNENKLIETQDGGSGQPGRWKIDHTKCTGCEECVYACMRRLLKLVDKRIVILEETDCNQCGDCSRACISRAIILT